MAINKSKDKNHVDKTSLQAKPQLGAFQFKDNRVRSDAHDGLVGVLQTKNNTGLPDDLKSGIENLSGMSMDSVKVHQNSTKPAEVGAHAFAQGTDIHIAPGQMKHLPHEAWHVVQQAQGRVQPTTSVGGMPVNDNASLESEADVMGAKAMQKVENIKDE